MPISYRIDTERGLIHTTVTETITIDELIAHKTALLADGQFRPGLRELSDVRGVTNLALGAPEIRRLASFDADHAAELGDYRLALVVPEDAVFGMARMYQQITEAHLPGIGVFRSVEQAVEWLGLDAPAK